MGLVIVLVNLHQVALADHATLRRLAQEMGQAATNLYTGSQQVMGPYPNYWQRYAYEHISFFHNSAHRFERVLGVRGEVDTRDHASDIRAAFQQLSHDLHHARETFPNLFYGVSLSSRNGSDDFESPEFTSTNVITRDHPQFGKLEGYLRYAESLIPQIQNQLP